MTQDEQNLSLLGVFHYIVGGLTALFSCLFLIHVFLGIAVLTGQLDRTNPPPPLLGWIFVLIPGFFILAGWTLAGFMVATGRKLRQRTARTFCLVMAGIECMIVPFGTILGVFTIVVLMKESVKALFEQPECL